MHCFGALRRTPAPIRGTYRSLKEPVMEPFRIDEIARRLFESVPPAMRTMQRDLEANFRSVLRSSLGKLDLV